MSALPTPQFVPAETRAVSELFKLQPLWEPVDQVPFQAALALHALAEDLGESVGVTLATLLWQVPGFPGRCVAELDRWLKGRELAAEIAAGYLDADAVQAMAHTAVPLGRVS